MTELTQKAARRRRRTITTFMSSLILETSKNSTMVRGRVPAKMPMSQINWGQTQKKRIAEIRREGVKETSRVIARGLSEDQAFLIEATLLYKLGKLTTNVASGRFADKFRAKDTLHKLVSGFDFRNGFYYYNTGEGPNRNWDDYAQFGFISAGQGPQWRDQICNFNEDDMFAAYINGNGYVGIGKILFRAQLIREVKLQDTPLLELPLRCQGMGENSNDPERSEYVCLVSWLAKVSREKAKSKKGLFKIRRLIRASLDGQPATVDYLEREFNVPIRDMIK